MNAQDIRTWRDEYDNQYDDELRELEERLTDVLATQEYITQDQLEDVIEWKLAGQPGRRDRNIGLMKSVPDAFIQSVSKAALVVDDPKIQVKTLTAIPGIGTATATVVLAFTDPANYAVGDRYMVAVLMDEDRGMRLTDYPILLDELRARNPDDFDLRTIEKAYYQRYRDEQNVGRW